MNKTGAALDARRMSKTRSDLLGSNDERRMSKTGSPLLGSDHEKRMSKTGSALLGSDHGDPSIKNRAHIAHKPLVRVVNTYN